MVGVGSDGVLSWPSESDAAVATDWRLLFAEGGCENFCCSLCKAAAALSNDSCPVSRTADGLEAVTGAVVDVGLVVAAPFAGM